MEIGKRFAQASALTATVAMAAIVGDTRQREPAAAEDGAAAPGAMAAPAPEPAPAVPTFVNGLAQNVFSAASADWISGEVWVESSFDTDGDGKLDRMHADYTLPRETATDGLKVPVIYEDSPYYAGTAGAKQLGRRPRAGRPAARARRSRRSSTAPTRARRSARSTRPRGSRAASRVVHSESPGSGYSDGCPTSGGPQRDARRDRRHRLAQRPSQGVHDPHRRRRGARRSTGTTATRR